MQKYLKEPNPAAWVNVGVDGRVFVCFKGVFFYEALNQGL